MTTIRYVKVECEDRENPVIWAYTEPEALQKVLAIYNENIIDPSRVTVKETTEEEARKTVIGRRTEIKDLVDDQRPTFNLGRILEVED